MAQILQAEAKFSMWCKWIISEGMYEEMQRPAPAEGQDHGKFSSVYTKEMLFAFWAHLCPKCFCCDNGEKLGVEFLT